MYHPFIDDPAHVALLDGQRYVVLRAGGAVPDAYDRVQGIAKGKLAGCDVSYPAQPHVTLLGLAKNTAPDAVRALVGEWASCVPALHIDIEGVSVFPTPFQIVTLLVRKTPDLARAMSSLRDGAQQRGLEDLAAIAANDWVFHLSVAYCSSLSAASWAEVEHWVGGMEAPIAQFVVSEAEIVAFDDGQESSAGVVLLTGSTVHRPVGL